MLALYRKYRPQNFSEVVGQKHIVQTLKNAVESGSVAHAYLFTGSRGVGKTTLARILARSVNCLEPKAGDACGKCRICQASADNSFLDLVEIDAASNTGVDNIRELIEHARFRPSLGRFKVFIIDEVHMLSRGAFNALLKTLEEPPQHIIFILATTEVHKVPATIISRTQRFDFSQLSASEISGALVDIAKKEKYKVSKEILAMIAERADGSMRDGLSILDKVFTLGQEPQVEDVQKLLGQSDIASCIKLFELILARDAKAIIMELEGLAYGGTNFEIFSRDFLEYLRKLLVVKLAGEGRDFGLAKDNLDSLTSQAAEISAGELMRVIRLFLRAYQETGKAPSPELPMVLASLEVFVRPGIAAASQPTGSQVINQTASKSAPTESTQEPAQKSVVEEQAEPIDLSKIKDHWPEVLAEIKKVNSPLATVVKNSTIFGAEDDKLIFSVRFKFDKESLESIKNAGVICQAIEKITGSKVRIGGKIVKPKDGEPEKMNSSLTDALTVFGGELVE